MAEAIVQSACTKLRSAIRDEAMVRWKLTDGLDEMVRALEAVKPLLVEAERRVVRGLIDEPEEKLVRGLKDEPEVRLVWEWLTRVRKSAYGICDMVDELQEVRRATPSAGKVTSILACCAVVPKKNPMAEEMKEVIEELRKIELESKKLGVKSSDPSFQQIIHETDLVEEEIIVGRDAEISSIMAACDTSEGPVILPIVGWEVQGKTALARLVFNHTRFKHHSRAWVHASQAHDLHKIGISVISQLSRGQESISHHGSSNHSMEYIMKRLHQLLNNTGSTKSLIVLDGLYLEKEDCIQFKRMFCVGDKSCKVIVIATLRSYMGQSFFTVTPITPGRLSDEMCWKIIKHKSGFEGRTESEQEDLEKIGQRIAIECSGQPFQAEVFGALLQYNDATGWAKALRSDVCQVLEQRLAEPWRIIACTIMPSNLTLCYAYCAMFPKGHTIVKSRLIHQWIALGLIEPQPSDRSSVTELAEKYIRSLLDLSLLRVEKPALTSEKDDKDEVLLIVHDVQLPMVAEAHNGSSLTGLGEEFILVEGRMDAAYQEYAGVESSSREKINQEHVRYAVFTEFDVMPLRWSILLPQLRAIHCIGCCKVKLSDDSFSSAKRLRVLELKDHSMQNLPETVCQLRHLACLSLSGCTELMTLPDSFGDLSALVYIDLSRCSRLKNLPKSLGKLTNLEHIDLSGCSALVTLPESFGKLLNLVRANLSGCSGLVTLPESIGKLINLEHADLSSCSRLVNLPRSFGNLIQLLHINLSGCSGLVTLPESFAKLTKLVHFDLSGCSRLSHLPRSFGNLISLLHLDLSRCHALVDLPRSFGNLISLLHLDLSHCHALVDLPQSFCNLEKLQHLDLSFWSSFEVIRKALGVTSLQHLNLSHPCSSIAENEPYSFEGLKEAMDKLKNLKYLNLSMFSHSQSEEGIGRYLENICVLGSLEHLDLSHNMYLRNVPECLAGLNKLHTLDLSGCIRLKTLPEKIYEMECLKLIALKHCRSLESYHFVVGARGNSVQLEDVNCRDMEISCLEKVKSVEEAQSIRLREKGRLVKLKLCWTPLSQELLDADILLGEVVPPHGLQCLVIHGYGSSELSRSPMAWWRPSICADLSYLTEVILEDIRSCTQLPPVGRSPNLQRLVLRKMASITRIDGCDLSFGNWQASKRLSELTIDDMPALEAFNTRYEGAGGKELMFPAIDVLVIKKCPKLVFVPLPPRAHRLEVLEECNKLMTASELAGGGRCVEGPACIVAPVTELVVESSTVNFADWSLLHHLPGLHSLTINKYSFLTIRNYRRLKISFPQDALSSLQILCFSSRNEMWSLPENLGDLTSLRELRISCSRHISFPESMKQLTSLKAMHLSDCGFRKLPSWLGDLTSLEILTIHNCQDLYSFPESICKLTSLKDLHVSESYNLRYYWCESKENKKVLAHIRLKYEQFVAPNPSKQSEQSDDTKGSTSNTSSGNGGGGDSSSELSEAQPSQRPNSPPRSPQWDIYLT